MTSRFRLAENSLDLTIKTARLCLAAGADGRPLLGDVQFLFSPSASLAMARARRSSARRAAWDCAAETCNRTLNARFKSARFHEPDNLQATVFDQWRASAEYCAPRLWCVTALRNAERIGE